jgi:hypothetical protein
MGLRIPLRDWNLRIASHIINYRDGVDIFMERSKDRTDEGEGNLKHAKNGVAGGYYNKLGAEARRHSVADLLKELSLKVQISEELMDGALERDKAYIPTRYPYARPSDSPRRRYTKGEAE